MAQAQLRPNVAPWRFFGAGGAGSPRSLFSPFLAQKCNEMDASGTAKGLCAAVQPSIWPRDEGDLDLFDKWISRWIFDLQIGHLEWPLSIPGCFFGMAPILIVGPLTLAVLSAPKNVPISIWLLLGLLWLVILYLWFAFCSGRRPELAQKLLFAKHSYLLGPLLGLLLSHLDSSLNSSLAGWFIMVWSAALVPVLTLKARTKRRRPAVCPSVPQTPRVIAILPQMPLEPTS